MTRTTRTNSTKRRIMRGTAPMTRTMMMRKTRAKSYLGRRGK